MVLLRFAPSPTGALHLGGLRTALYNHLFAKKTGGKWILRIEDTDASRRVPGAVEDIRNALAWAGLEYDHGPGRDGPHAPYYQSERLDLYHSYANKLLNSGHAYHCFCSPGTLASTRERLARVGSNATYDKTCLQLTEEEVSRRVRAGEKSIIRLNDGKLPSRPTPPDIVFGVLKDAHASLPTDPVLLKSDKFPTYHLASVVDDHEMGITHVIRGEEWLPSLPLHLDLYACLSLQPPQFAHLPILLNQDGTKMSKRKGDVHVTDYIKRGWEPEAVLNWLALAGWGTSHDNSDAAPSAPGTSEHRPAAPINTEIMSLSDLVTKFDLTSLTHRRNILNPLKLEFLNKNHLSRLWSTREGLDALAHRSYGIVKEAFPSSQYVTVDYIKAVIQVLQARLTNIQDIPSLSPYLFVEPDLSSVMTRAMLKSISANDYSQALRNVSVRLLKETDPWHIIDFDSILHDSNTIEGMTHKDFMTILRHALSAMKTGPSVAEIIRVLGRERTIGRLSPA